MKIKVNQYNWKLTPVSPIVLALLFFLSGCHWLYSLEPLTQEEYRQFIKDGTFQERLKNALTLKNDKVAPHLLENLKIKLQKKQRFLPTNDMSEIQHHVELPSAWKGMPSSGNIKMFVILIAFNDLPPMENNPTIADNIFGTGPQSQFPYESLNRYYIRSSYGQLNLQGNVLGWYTTPYPRSSVPQTDAGREAVIVEALNYFDAQGHDFSQYDNNGDGEIDYFGVIWTGQNNGWSSFWWGYQTMFTNTNYFYDGKRVNNYSWQWESRDYPQGSFSPKTLIHETGHALGLPDYYDYKKGTGPEGGIGGLDMMDATSGDHNCFSKMLLGWVDPLIISNSVENMTLRSSASNPDALLIMPDATEETVFDEFFMVQNRFRENNDILFPADGLLIWHVDSRLNSLKSDYIYNNSYTPHKLLRLMEADGYEDIENLLKAEPGDFYTEGKEFNANTTPDSNRYDGTKSHVFVTNISTPAPQMSFTAGTQLPIRLTIQVSKQMLSSWLIKRYVGIVDFQISFIEPATATKYVLSRKLAGSQYTSVAEIDPASLSTSQTNHYIDKYLEKGNNYYYKLTAYGENGQCLGISNEVNVF